MGLARYAKPIAASLLGLGLMALAAAIVYANLGTTASTQPAAAAASSPVSVVNGITTVRIDPAVQQRSGIVVQPLPAMTVRSESTAYGSVIDLQPLIELRARHDAAAAEADSAHAVATVSRAEAERNRSLYEDQQNVSLKALQAAQAAQRADEAKVEAAVRALQDLEAAAVQQYGEVLARWALQRPVPQAFARLMARREVVARVVLAPGTASAPPMIDVLGGDGRRVSASLITAAAQGEPGAAGVTYLYRVPAPLPSGASIVARLSASAPKPGVFVSSHAVVWYAGQPWVYVQTDAVHFARRPLLHALEQEDGYVVSDGLRSGERVVTQGAGLLLSEEQRPPPGAPGCKDPECD